MSINIESIDTAKSLAKSLRTLLKERAGLTLPVGASLEVVAGLGQAANWDTLSGLLTQKPIVIPAAQLLAPGQELNLYLNAYACSEWGAGPSWAKIGINQAFLNYLRSKHQAVLAAKASELTDHGEPDAWDDADVRLVMGELVVSSDGSFFYQAREKHADYRVETCSIQLETLEKMVKQALAEGVDYVLYHATDVDLLKEALNASDELLFCAECEAKYDGAADGWNGLCPSCADKESQS